MEPVDAGLLSELLVRFYEAHQRAVDAAARAAKAKRRADLAELELVVCQVLYDRPDDRALLLKLTRRLR